jgi:hypothetical protein
LSSFCFLNTVNEWGGGEKWHLEVAHYLHAQGHRVLVMAQSGSALATPCNSIGD